MANLGGRDEFEDLEEENMRWATEWDEADDAIHADARRIYLKLAKIRREKRKLIESVHKGGRKRKQYGSYAKFDGGARNIFIITSISTRERIDRKRPTISKHEWSVVTFSDLEVTR